MYRISMIFFFFVQTPNFLVGTYTYTADSRFSCDASPFTFSTLYTYINIQIYVYYPCDVSGSLKSRSPNRFSNLGPTETLALLLRSLYRMLILAHNFMIFFFFFIPYIQRTLRICSEFDHTSLYIYFIALTCNKQL